ncbi:MAG: low molecular weight protein arginine phosphatase [Clostridia bacterium]|nr:low molecular weight protein arginine phosphatase [Clostridia bacterium]
MVVDSVSRRILVICGGNTCRSPMAEVMLRSMLLRSGAAMGSPSGDAADTVVESAGAAAVDGMSASQKAIAALARIGLDLSGHRSRALTREIISKADVILAMEVKHAARAVELDPNAADRTRTLADHNIPDPYGGSLDEYERTRDQIEAALRKYLNEDRGDVS